MQKFNGFLYHITRYKKLELGEKLYFGQIPNRFAKKMFSTDFAVGNYDINQLFMKKTVQDFSAVEAKSTKNYIYESCQMLRELVLEQIRLKEFPKHPSRLECLYCCKTYQEAKSWINALKRMQPNQPPLQIVKLKAKGKIFEGDGSLMLRNTYSLNSKIDMARQYWNGSNNPIMSEILFVGTAQVVEISELEN